MPDQRVTSSRPLRVFLRQWCAPRDNLYAIADAARDRELAFAARDRFGFRTRSIFQGRLAEKLDDVAPYLITLERDSRYLNVWERRLGRNAGILLVSEADADSLWMHLRGIFVVTDEDGARYSFRYYDPRVLRVYLPTCTADEARGFFGPIRRLFVESLRPGHLLSCEPTERGVNIVERALAVDASRRSPRGGRR